MFEVSQRFDLDAAKKSLAETAKALRFIKSPQEVSHLSLLCQQASFVPRVEIGGSIYRVIAAEDCVMTVEKQDTPIKCTINFNVCARSPAVA